MAQFAPTVSSNRPSLGAVWYLVWLYREGDLNALCKLFNLSTDIISKDLYSSCALSSRGLAAKVKSQATFA